MRITCKTRDFLGIDRLSEFQHSVKKRSSKDIEDLIASINKLGFTFPFYVWKNDGVNVTIDGHGRLAALKYMRDSLGETIPPLPVVFIDADDVNQAKEKLLQCNARYGLFIQSNLKDWLAGVDFDAAKIKIPEVNLNNMAKEIPEVKIRFANEPEACSKSGVVYHLLDASVMCGDATDIEVFNELLKKEKIDLCLTSPPYNQKTAKAPRYGAADNFYLDETIDDKSETDQIETCLKVLENMSYFVNGRHTVVWNVSYTKADRNSYGKIIFSPRNPFQVMDTIVWDKGMGMAMPQSFYRRCEMVFVMSVSERSYLCNIISNKETNYWNISPMGAQQDIHKACFPINLANRAIKLFSDMGNVVIDPFCGAGTSLISAQLLGRKSYGIEISPKYVDLIRRRFSTWALDMEYSPRQIGDGYLEADKWEDRAHG
ncbi:MAG: DNA modification methylase [Treponema sp.]|jgi:DNA modification methylase|nr:DNA modification methylase [Treponema sp.]